MDGAGVQHRLKSQPQIHQNCKGSPLFAAAFKSYLLAVIGLLALLRFFLGIKFSFSETENLIFFLNLLRNDDAL